MDLNADRLLAIGDALGNPHRLRIIAALSRGRVHVSELARQLEVSRPLLYLHLEKLEAAGLVSGSLELSPDGKAMKYYEIQEFEIRITPEAIASALKKRGGG
jgi:predicted transcriptional regulator